MRVALKGLGDDNDDDDIYDTVRVALEGLGDDDDDDDDDDEDDDDDNHDTVRVALEGLGAFPAPSPFVTPGRRPLSPSPSSTSGLFSIIFIIIAILSY